MAVEQETPDPKPYPFSTQTDLPPSTLLSSYLGLSFSIFLGFLPRLSLSHITSLQSRNRILSLKLFHAEEQLRQLRSRRKEDSKANARVVDIFATHRHAWQQEQKRFLHRIDAAEDEISALRSRIGEMERSEAEMRRSIEGLRGEVAGRDEMIELMSRREMAGEDVAGSGEFLDGEGKEEEDYCEDYERMGRVRVSTGMKNVMESGFAEEGDELEEMGMVYCRAMENGFAPGFLDLEETSKRWLESPNMDLQEQAGSSSRPSKKQMPTEQESQGDQDIQFDSQKSTYYGKHHISRREYPWRVGSDAAGVSSKLKLLEQELSNLEKVENLELTNVPLLRKIWKRYHSLAGKVDDLCSRMQLGDSCEPSLSPDFRTKQQTMFLVEASSFQHRAKEMRQKLNVLHTETAKSHQVDDLTGAAKLAVRRSMDSMRSNFKEIQRNLEVWLARIMGDLEGILARDGNSTVREYYTSRYPFVR